LGAEQLLDLIVVVSVVVRFLQPSHSLDRSTILGLSSGSIVHLAIVVTQMGKRVEQCLDRIGR